MWRGTATHRYGAQGKDSTAALKAALSRVRKHTLDTNSQQHVELLTLATSEGHRAYQDAADETFSSLTDTEALSDAEISAFHMRALVRAPCVAVRGCVWLCARACVGWRVGKQLSRGSVVRCGCIVGYCCTRSHRAPLSAPSRRSHLDR